MRKTAWNRNYIHFTITWPAVIIQKYVWLVWNCHSMYWNILEISYDHVSVVLLMIFSFDRWIITESPRMIADPSFLCDSCFRSYHYIDGKKIGHFKATRYWDCTIFGDEFDGIYKDERYANPSHEEEASVVKWFITLFIFYGLILMNFVPRKNNFREKWNRARVIFEWNKCIGTHSYVTMIVFVCKQLNL